jgi:uncharacterized protein YutE (UPF0331/DUF86 family)
MRILSQLQILDEALEAWQRYQQIPFPQFAQERDIQYMVCHAMLIALQASIDIATGIAVTKTPKRPDTYRETFQLLGRSSIIPEDLARELSKLAGFRNLLVHEYTGLDLTQVYRILQTRWQTLDTFRILIRDLIRENETVP